MKKYLIFFLLISVVSALADTMTIESYLSHFDYKARKDMKITSQQLVEAIAKGRVQFIDIRFQEEHQAWNSPLAKNIPLNELPKRLNELNRDKIIVTACPHKDRAILAMVFLRTKGFQSKYLVDGLTGFAEYLRGDKARILIQRLKQ